MAVKNITPEEAWKGNKPNYFKVFGCIAFAHVPDVKRKKLDDKAQKCIFFGVSEHSKAYKLYNPVTKRIIISRDVVFDESKAWKWTVNSIGEHIPVNDDELEEERQSQSSSSTITSSPSTPSPNSQVEVKDDMSNEPRLSTHKNLSFGPTSRIQKEWEISDGRTVGENRQS